MFDTDMAEGAVDGFHGSVAFQRARKVEHLLIQQRQINFSRVFWIIVDRCLDIFVADDYRPANLGEKCVCSTVLSKATGLYAPDPLDASRTGSPDSNGFIYVLGACPRIGLSPASVIPAKTGIQETCDPIARTGSSASACIVFALAFAF